MKLFDSLLGLLNHLRVSRNLVLFLFFLLIASVSWILTALNQDYTTDINCRLVFTDLPGNKTLSSLKEPSVSVNVKGHGYTLAWHKLNPDTRIPFSLSNTGIQSGLQNGVYRYWLLSRQLTEKLQPSLSPALSIQSIAPDTLYINLCEKISRKVPVIADLNLRFSRQYMLCGPVVVVPDSISISGPRTVVDTLAFILTERHRTPQLHETYAAELRLKAPDIIHLSENTAEIRVCAEKFTEGELTVPLSILNLPGGVDIKTFPPTVKLSYRVTLSKYKEVQPDLFTCSIDYLEAIQPGTDKLQLRLQRSPAFVEGIKLSPETVDFIIEK